MRETPPQSRPNEVPASPESGNNIEAQKLRNTVNLLIALLLVSGGTMGYLVWDANREAKKRNGEDPAAQVSHPPAPASSKPDRNIENIFAQLQKLIVKFAKTNANGEKQEFFGIQLGPQLFATAQSAVENLGPSSLPTIVNHDQQTLWAPNQAGTFNLTSNSDLPGIAFAQFQPRISGDELPAFPSTANFPNAGEATVLLNPVTGEQVKGSVLSAQPGSKSVSTPGYAANPGEPVFDRDGNLVGLVTSAQPGHAQVAPVAQKSPNLASGEGSDQPRSNTDIPSPPPTAPQPFNLPPPNPPTSPPKASTPPIPTSPPPKTPPQPQPQAPRAVAKTPERPQHHSPHVQPKQPNPSPKDQQNLGSLARALSNPGNVNKMNVPMSGPSSEFTSKAAGSGGFVTQGRGSGLGGFGKIHGLGRIDTGQELSPRDDKRLREIFGPTRKRKR